MDRNDVSRRKVLAVHALAGFVDVARLPVDDIVFGLCRPLTPSEHSLRTVTSRIHLRD